MESGEVSSNVWTNARQCWSSRWGSEWNPALYWCQCLVVADYGSNLDYRWYYSDVVSAETATVSELQRGKAQVPVIDPFRQRPGLISGLSWPELRRLCPYVFGSIVGGVIWQLSWGVIHWFF